MTQHSRWFILAALAAAAGLTACGGGGGDSPALTAADSNTVPATATVSAEAFSSYVGSSPSVDVGEPLNLDGVTPPTSDQAEPAELSV